MKYQKQFKVGLFSYLRHSRLIGILVSPIIYSLAIPLVFLDIAVTFYQWVCFPVYGIKYVKRSDHIAIDRHKLAYLNSIEKFNCVYCGYAQGFISYLREIGSRTEQYFCPIKNWLTFDG